MSNSLVAEFLHFEIIYFWKQEWGSCTDTEYLFKPVLSQFLTCATCLHLVQTKWDEGSAALFLSSTVFKNAKVQ